VSISWHCARNSENAVWIFKWFFCIKLGLQNYTHRGTPHSTHNYVFCNGVFYMPCSLKFMSYGTLSIVTILRHGYYSRRVGVKYPPWVIWFFSTATKLTRDRIHLMKWVTVIERLGFGDERRLTYAEPYSNFPNPHMPLRHHALSSIFLMLYQFIVW